MTVKNNKLNMCSSGLQFIGNNCIHGEQFGFHLLHYRPSNRLRNLAKGLLQILTQVNSLNCKLRSVSGELKSAVYVYRRANDYCDYSSHLHENKPSSSGPDSAGLFKVAASVEKKKGFPHSIMGKCSITGWASDPTSACYFKQSPMWDAIIS